MCMGSLMLIFTRSFKTWQPTRPYGLVTSKFDRQSLKTSVKIGYVVIPHLQSRYSLSKLPRKYAICPRRSPWQLAHCYRALALVRVIRHCVIGQERDLVWSNWLIDGHWPRELWNPLRTALFGKFHRSGGHDIHNGLQDWANFHRSLAWQIFLNF